VKLPRTITHEARLVDAMHLAAAFRTETHFLGEKLGPLLVQLPPSLAFSSAVAERFFGDLRSLWPEPMVCEPRHESWFEGEAEALLCEHHVGRVGADPARHRTAAEPGGWKDIAYWRLHGSPRMYYSVYDQSTLNTLALRTRAEGAGETWCVFDNTASGAATGNALSIQAMISR